MQLERAVISLMPRDPDGFIHYQVLSYVVFINENELCHSFLLQFSTFVSGVVILLTMYGNMKAKSNTDTKTAMENAQRCINSLKAMGSKYVYLF
jgi:hypothetical protein